MNGAGAKAQRKRASSSKRGLRERAASIEQFRSMLVAVLRGGGSQSVANAAGFPHEARSLRRYAGELRADPRNQRDSEAETLDAQVNAAAVIDFKAKNINFESRRMFEDEELQVFERIIIKYAEMGWPLDFAAIQRLMSKTADLLGRTDWKTGLPFVVSSSYVRKFVRRSPSLKSYKTSNIDPMRSKKASLSVRVRMCCCSCHE